MRLALSLPQRQLHFWSLLMQFSYAAAWRDRSE